MLSVLGVAALATFTAPIFIDLGDAEFTPFEWSHDGKTFAYVHEGSLHTLFPERKVSLPEHEYEWMLDGWSADGKTTLLVSLERAISIDLQSRAITELPADHDAWFIGNTLCLAPRIHQMTEASVQPWTFGSEKRTLPVGFSFIEASRDGKLMIVFDQREVRNGPDKQSFTLFVLNENGEPRWSKQLGIWGRTDLHYEPLLSWNEYYDLAAIGLDTSGGGSFIARVVAQDGYVSLDPTPGEYDYPWTRTLQWLDNRYLFAHLSLSHNYIVDGLTDRLITTDRLMLYDAKTRKLRPIYESPSMLGAEASAHYLAVLERREGRSRLVISPWRRMPSGEIISSVYVPHDAVVEPLDREEWRRYIDNEYLEPLPFKRDKRNPNL